MVVVASKPRPGVVVDTVEVLVDWKNRISDDCLMPFAVELHFMMERSKPLAL